MTDRTKDRLEFDFEDELEELKKVDPLFAKYYKLFVKIQQHNLNMMLKLINKYDEERQMRLMDLITRMAMEMAQSKKESLTTQWEEVKKIITELVNMFSGFQYTPVQTPPKKVQVNIQES